MMMFAADMGEALRSASAVGQLRPKRLEICHGGAVLDPASGLEAYRRNYAKLEQTQIGAAEGIDRSL